VHQLAGAVEAVVRVLGHRLDEHLLDRVRHVRTVLAQARRRIGHVRVQHRRLGVLGIGHHAAQALVQHAGEGVDVALLRGRLAPDLLGRDVVERADELPCLGQAEVRQVGLVTAADQDVLRLDVAVDQAGLMRRVERAGRRGEDPQRPAGVELACHDQVLQVGAAHEPHRDEEATVGLARVEDRDDVRVVDARLDLALPLEAGDERGVVAQVRRQHLERDHSIEGQLGGLVDGPHATLAEDAVDAVTGKGRALFQYSRWRSVLGHPLPSPTSAAR
jgi:hypothetical protein